MTERGRESSPETPAHKIVSDIERIALKRDAQLEKICSRAIEVKDELVANKIKPDAIINVVANEWSDKVIEADRCWIITNHPSVHKLGKLGMHFTTGYALREAGDIIEYETEEVDIKKNPTLYHVPGKQIGEIITESPFDPEEYLDNGIMRGLDELSERAKIATNK